MRSTIQNGILPPEGGQIVWPCPVADLLCSEEGKPPAPLQKKKKLTGIGTPKPDTEKTVFCLECMGTPIFCLVCMGTPKLSMATQSNKESMLRCFNLHITMQDISMAMPTAIENL